MIPSLGMVAVLPSQAALAASILDTSDTVRAVPPLCTILIGGDRRLGLIYFCGIPVYALRPPYSGSAENSATSQNSDSSLSSLAIRGPSLIAIATAAITMKATTKLAGVTQW